MLHRIIVRLAILAMLLFVLAVPAFAHEEREIGEYEVEFGWRNEPALTGLLNGPIMFINLDGAPISGDVAVELTVEVSFGPETTLLTLRPAFEEDGQFIADLIPTMPGDYSFRVTGTIGETAVDEVFTSADGGFGTVEPVTDIMFPPALPSEAEGQIAALEARIIALEEQLAALQEGQ